MQVAYLNSLDRAAGLLLRQATVREDIAKLKDALRVSTEPFVWAIIDCAGLASILPPEIQSAWIFVLRHGVWSGTHYHPNSVQHMIMVQGEGRARIAGAEQSMLRHDAPGRTPEERWQVIGEHVPHEFLPEGQDMVVISFHTCPPDELIEIESGTGHSRHYEPKKTSA